MRPDIKEVVVDHYESARRYQTFTMKREFLLTLEEFIDLYPQKIINAIGHRLDRGGREDADRYMAGNTYGPVLGWRNRDVAKSNLIIKDHMLIEYSYLQRGRFGNQKGDTLSPETKALMSKPKDSSPKAVKRRSDGQARRRERERLAKEQGK